MWGQVVGERGVAVGVEAEVDPVEPDVGVLVDAVEPQLDTRAFAAPSGSGVVVQREPLAVPADAAHGEARVPLSLASREVERAYDARRLRRRRLPSLRVDEDRGVAGGRAVV